jgi:diketogulonate reductase-like aldo/keto reductase
MEERILSNGVKMPAVGFGCYKVNKANMKTLIKNAYESGYRHFDTASFYQNETEIGEAIKELGINRSELFITSKVWKTQMEDPELAFFESLKKLQTNYIDLYLIHWPRPTLQLKNWKELDLKVWRVLEKLYKKGYVRSIGVSNFLPQHLIPILNNCEIKPMVDQLEIHPGYGQECAVQFAQNHGLQVEAWSPLGRDRLDNNLLIDELSKKYNKTKSQIKLRFAVQQNIVPLPKASSIEHMKQNIDLFGFALSEEDMYRLRTLSQAGWSGEHPDFERVYFK